MAIRSAVSQAGSIYGFGNGAEPAVEFGVGADFGGAAGGDQSYDYAHRQPAGRDRECQQRAADRYAVGEHDHDVYYRAIREHAESRRRYNDDCFHSSRRGGQHRYRRQWQFQLRWFARHFQPHHLERRRPDGLLLQRLHYRRIDAQHWLGRDCASFGCAERLSTEWGRQAGAVETYATKSGTNRVHGLLHRTYNSDGLNANDFFNN